MMQKIRQFARTIKTKILVSKFLFRYWGGTQRFWYLNKFHIALVNLGGESAVSAFDYTNCPIEGMNWAINNQSLTYDFNILKNYFSYLKPGAVVLITLHPLSFLYHRFDKSNNLKYYTFLHPATILNFNETERIKALRRKKNPFHFTILCACFKYLFSDFVCGLKLLLPHNYAKDAAHTIALWEKQVAISDTFNMDTAQPIKVVHIMELREMINFCMDRTLQPVIVLPPLHPALKQGLKASVINNLLYDCIRQANINNYLVIDYLFDESFADNHYFRNLQNLNKTGAKKFTKQIIADLCKNRLL